MIVGFDLDGVVATNPWRYISRRSVVGKCIAIISVFFYYILRKPNKPIVDLLREYNKRGHRIVFISGIWGVAQPIILLWLKWHHIPFDKIVLRWKKSCKEFKVSQILFHKCEMYVEDDPEIASFIKEKCEIIQQGVWQINGVPIYVMSFA